MSVCRRNFFCVPMIALLVITTACSPVTRRAALDPARVEAEARRQREVALENLFAEQKRLTDVGFPLRVAAAALCHQQVAPATGILYLNRDGFPEDFRDTAHDLYGMDGRLMIAHVTPGSPADHAGLQDGDLWLASNGIPTPQGEKAVAEMTRALQHRLVAGEPFTIRYQRGEVVGETRLTPVEVCDFPVLRGDGDEVNAFADGDKVVIASGMLRFTRNDQELALVIAHELAHNAMGHIRSQTTNYVLGSIIDFIAAAYGIHTGGTFGSLAARVFSQEFEAEADYVGLYIMARAGLPIRDAAQFWRRMGALHPASIGRSHASSHPASPERFVAIESTLAEIEAKKGRGESLLPNLKKSPAE